jgi:hypothetical protein
MSTAPLRQGKNSKKFAISTRITSIYAEKITLYWLLRKTPVFRRQAAIL